MNKTKIFEGNVKKHKNNLKSLSAKLITGIILILLVGFIMYSLLFAVMYFI